MPISTLLLGAMAGLIVCLSLSWRQNVKLVLWLLVVEGVLRKWIIPGAADLIYFVKDGVMFIAYLKYVLHPPQSMSTTRMWRGVQFLILSITLYIFVSAMNPDLGSPLVGIVGARNYLFYVPLMFIVRHLFESEEEMMRFIRSYLLGSLPVFALALYQYWSPRDAWINQFVADSGATSGLVGGKVRVAAAFSYIAGYTCYIQTIVALAIPLLVLRQDRLWQILIRVAFVCAIAGIPLTGSRGPALTLGLFLVGYFLINREVRGMGLYKRLVAAVIVCTLVAGAWMSTAFENYAGRFKKNRDLSSRITIYYEKPVEYARYAGVAGYGPGATYQAVNRLRSMFQLRQGTEIPVYYESEPERIMLELGILGFVFWYGLRIALIVSLWKTYKGLSQPFTREFALVALLVHLTGLPHQMVFQVTFMVYYWFFAGFVLLLPELEAKEAARHRALETGSADGQYLQ